MARGVQGDQTFPAGRADLAVPFYRWHLCVRQYIELCVVTIQIHRQLTRTSRISLCKYNIAKKLRFEWLVSEKQITNLLSSDRHRLSRCRLELHLSTFSSLKHQVSLTCKTKVAIVRCNYRTAVENEVVVFCFVA